MKIIREVDKNELKDLLYHIDIEDQNLYKEVNKKNNIGIFQLSGKAAEKVKEEIVPCNFDELNAVLALARPGTINFVDEYVDGKFNSKIKYPKKVNALLEETKGICLFQEQIMSIFHKVGGFTLEGANKVRGIMKKLSKTDKREEDVKQWNKAVKKFKKGCISNEINKIDAEILTNDMLSFSSYSFNKSHSSAYTYIAIMTLYLSFYFKKYFLSSALQFEDKHLFERLQSVKGQGFNILPPDINRSEMHFTPIGDNEILFGLNDIKYVGENPVKIIMENRPYRSVIDFIIRTRSRVITSKVITAIISVGCFDEIDKNRKKLLLIFEKFHKEKKSTKIEEKLRAVWKKCEDDISNIPAITTDLSYIRECEREYFGFIFFTSLFTKEKILAFNKMYKNSLIYLDFKSIGNNSRKVPVCINSIRIVIDKNDNQMAFVDMEDINGITKSVPVFASYWKYIKDKFIINSLYLLNLYLDDRVSILFGKRQWTTSEFSILRMVKKI